MTGQVLFDTNILIDWSKGYAEALTELAYWDLVHQLHANASQL